MNRIIFLLSFFGILSCLAGTQPALAQGTTIPDDIIFKAEIVEILTENITIREDGSTSIQQTILLRALDGAYKNQMITYHGEYYDVLSVSEYNTGDRVIVQWSDPLSTGGDFYIIDYVRNVPLYWLAILFGLLVIAIGKWKGLRALFVLGISFLVILKFIIPLIIQGMNPLFVGMAGCLLILVCAIYITEGFKKTSHIAVLTILITLFITQIISVWFVALTKLTGFGGGDETTYLLELAGGAIDIRGLLLAGILIGALGVLDDVVISQVALVETLHKNNNTLSRWNLYKEAMRVGISHLSSMVNTLFLAYAGASLPLLILFQARIPPFTTFFQTLNHETIATEIVRTLAGSIGIVLAVPLATVLAVYFLKSKNQCAQPR